MKAHSVALADGLFRIMSILCALTACDLLTHFSPQTALANGRKRNTDSDDRPQESGRGPRQIGPAQTPGEKDLAATDGTV